MLLVHVHANPAKAIMVGNCAATSANFGYIYVCITMTMIPKASSPWRSAPSSIFPCAGVTYETSHC
jgi:hypothetical protein